MSCKQGRTRHRQRFPSFCRQFFHGDQLTPAMARAKLSQLIVYSLINWEVLWEKRVNRELKPRRWQKCVGLISKTTTLHVHHAFLYICLPSLHDYDVKIPIFMFCGGREHNDFLFLFLNPLSPNIDKDQFSLNNIHTLSRDKLWELINWSFKRKCFDLISSNSLN